MVNTEIPAPVPNPHFPDDLLKAVPELLLEQLRPTLNALVVCLSNSWGGLEQVAARDSMDLSDAGFKVKVLCLQGSPIHESLLNQRSVVLVPLDFKPRNLLDLNLLHVLHQQIAEGVNLIHTHQTSLLGSIAPWLIRKPNVALVATRHILNVHSKRDIFHTALYQRIDTLIVMSHMLRRNVLETHRIPEKRVRVVNLGLDFGRFDPAKIDARAQRLRWGATDDTIVIGVVGRIDPEKGQATFIRAAAGLMKNKKPFEKFKFVLVGEETLGTPSVYLEELKRIVAEFRMEDEIVFSGFQENIPEIMRAFDIFTMPSRRETFGLVAIEAMAMERPIIMSSGGSAREIFGGDQEFGLIMRPDDAFDLQRKIRLLLDNPDRCLEMGKKARYHVMQQYSAGVRFRKTLEIYAQVLLSRGISF
jgi:glycosyltransferase involved in cell wall biosynthesis